MKVEKSATNITSQELINLLPSILFPLHFEHIINYPPKITS